MLTMHHNIGTKCGLINESSTYFWHKLLDHISKKRIKRLVRNETFRNLGFTNLETYMDCIKGKQKKYTVDKSTTRSS